MLKRFIASLAIGMTALTGQVQAWVGGPFDNGDYNRGMEVNSIYQAVLTFGNGGGYCYFDPGQAIASNNAAVPAAVNQRGSISNRTVLYYKGVSYVGSAFGMSDLESSYIQCTMNGTSESTYQTAATQQNTNAFTLSSTTSTALSTTVVASARSFTFNGHWEARVTDTAPSVRFSGKGEIAFLSPAGPDAVAGLAFNGYSGLIQAIITAVGNAQPGVLFPATFFDDAADSLNSLLNDLPPHLVGAGIDVTEEFAQVRKMKVNGTRRYVPTVAF